MSLGHHSTAPTGLGEGNWVVLMVASGFSASILPEDNTGAAGTCPCFELCGTCAAMPVLSGSSQRRRLSWAAAWGAAGSMWLHSRPLESCVIEQNHRIIKVGKDL